MFFTVLLFIFFIVLCGFIGYEIYKMTIAQKKAQKEIRETKLAEMREAGQCCYNCKFISRGHGFVADECKRSCSGYDPITGSATSGGWSHFPRCGDVVGTEQCGWEKE